MGAAQHDLRDVHAQLDAKISDLKAKLLQVPNIPENADCRAQMLKSLKDTEEGKRILFDGCCFTQICNFNWRDDNQQV